MNSMPIAPNDVAIPVPHQVYPVLFHKDETRLDSITNDVLLARLSRHLPHNFEVSIRDDKTSVSASSPQMGKKVFTLFRKKRDVFKEYTIAFFRQLKTMNNEPTYQNRTPCRLSQSHTERRIIPVLLCHPEEPLPNIEARDVLANLFRTCRKIELCISYDGHYCVTHISEYPKNLTIIRSIADFLNLIRNFHPLLISLSNLIYGEKCTCKPHE